MNNVYFREGNWIICKACDAHADVEYGLPPCACGSKAGKSASVSTFRKGAEHELTQSDLEGIAEATTRATVEFLRGGGGDDASQSSSAKLALRKGPVGSPLWQREKQRIDGIRLRSRAAADHAEAQMIAVEHGTAAVVRFALGGGAW